jgi:hypothetical protein
MTSPRVTPTLITIGYVLLTIAVVVIVAASIWILR